jgi:hypothetical protein
MLDWWIFSKTHKVKCPDGRIAMVYKNIDDAFPFALNDREFKASAQGSAPGVGDLQIGGEYKSGCKQNII